jgi:F-type H+-transporting ATPase subunit b
MSNSDQKSAVPYPVKLAVGVLFMAGGTYLSVSGALEGINKPLAAKGIPLDLGITLAVIGVFLILFPVIQSFYLNPLQEAIDERNNDLESTFAEVEELRTSMTQMRADYEQRLAEKEAEARTQIQTAIKEAQQLRQSLMAEATERADAMVRQAEAEIAADRAQALTEIRASVVNLSLAAAEKVVGETMTSDRNRKLVATFIDELEVAK